MDRYIYIYMLLGWFAAPQNGFLGSICGPPWVHLRPPMGSFAAPPFWNHWFYSAKWFFAVSGNKVSSLFSDFSGFSKMPFWRSSKSFFAVRTNFRSLRVFLVWALPSAIQEVLGRETLQNKGFRSNFALWAWLICVGPVVSPSCCSPFLTQIFRRLTNLFFSEVRIFDQIGFGRQKKAWGCRTEEIFKMTFFPFCPGGAQLVKFLARFRFYSSVAVWVPFGPLPEICLRLRCGWFFRCSFLDSVFCEFEKGSFENPLSSFRVLLFSAFSSSAWVDATLHACFGAVGPKPFFSFCFFVCLFTKTLFSPWKRVIFVHFSMSHFLSPWFPSLLLFIPCLSLSLVFFFLSFLVFCFFLWPFLFFCCSFLPCCFAFISWQQQHQNIRCERHLFINLLCFFLGFLFLVSPIPFFYLCFWLFKFCVLVNMNVFVFLSRPFLKHRFLFCILWNIIVFLGPIL